MEKRELLDKNRKQTGEITMADANRPEGKYIPIVIIIIRNNQNEFLIQKRAEKKNGKWASTGGHVIMGENSLQAILREVSEEIGLLLKENEIEMVFTKKTYDCFVDIYYAKKDVDVKKLKLQKEEVDKVKWASIDEVEDMKRNGEFLESHYDCLKECMYFLEKVEEEKKECIN